MTKTMTAEGWAYIVVVNDWFTKTISGVSVSTREAAPQSGSRL